MSKTTQPRLSELRERIVIECFVAEWREVWFFPRMGGVMGWQGDQDIIFASPIPSTGTSGGPGDRFYYAELAKHAFGNAHLTDLVKERATAAAATTILNDRSRLLPHHGYFMEELAIVRPRLIVPVGATAARLLAQWLPDDRRVCEPILHYSQRIPTAVTTQRFQMQMAGIAALYNTHAPAAGLPNRRLAALSAPAARRAAAAPRR